MAKPKLAIDVSNFWLPGPVSDRAAFAFMDEAQMDGVKRVIAGTQIPSVCNQQLVAAANCGMDIQAYVQLSWSHDWYDIFRQFDNTSGARWAVGDLPVSMLWVALEGEPKRDYVHTHSLISEAIRAAKRHGFKKVGLYTNPSWWAEKMGNTRDFRSYPFWLAYYDDVADRRVGPVVGGWSGRYAPRMKQYNQNRNLAGMNVDWNVY